MHPVIVQTNLPGAQGFNCSGSLLDPPNGGHAVTF